MKYENEDLGITLELDEDMTFDQLALYEKTARAFFKEAGADSLTDAVLWQGALEGLRNGQRGRRRADPSQQLQTEIERLRAVVTELSAENLQLKKGLWP